MRAGRAQFACPAAAVDNRRDCVLEDELLFAVVFEQHRKLVKALDATGNLRPVHEVDCHNILLAASRVEEGVLNVLRRRFCIHR